MKKVLIWGTGKIASRFIENGCNGEIIGFIETNKSKNLNKIINNSRNILSD